MFQCCIDQSKWRLPSIRIKFWIDWGINEDKEVTQGRTLCLLSREKTSF